MSEATETQPARKKASAADGQGDQSGVVAGYHGGEEMPLAAFAGLIGLYGASFGAFLLATKQRDRPLPERIALGDLLLLGVATHKLSRLITQDWVTSPLRAPFTEYHGSSGAGEVSDKARGKGMQRALGELFT